MGRAFLFGCPEVLSPIGRRSRSDAAGTVLLGRRCSALLLNGGGLCGTVSGVKIDARTSQAELNLLVERGLRRDFLKCTPLNLKQFIPFTLLFLLFPGMVLGWRIGGLLTALFAAFLTGCLIWDAPAWPRRGFGSRAVLLSHRRPSADKKTDSPVLPPIVAPATMTLC